MDRQKLERRAEERWRKPGEEAQQPPGEEARDDRAAALERREAEPPK